MNINERKKYWYKISGADDINVGPVLKHIFKIVSSMIAALEMELIGYIDHKTDGGKK